MKATIDIPDELYRRVKAKSALLGKPVREVTVELYRRWLAEDSEPGLATDAKAWLQGWLELADCSTKAKGKGTAREQLASGRGRLE